MSWRSGTPSEGASPSERPRNEASTKERRPTINGTRIFPKFLAAETKSTLLRTGEIDEERVDRVGQKRIGAERGAKEGRGGPEGADEPRLSDERGAVMGQKTPEGRFLASVTPPDPESGGFGGTESPRPLGGLGGEAPQRSAEFDEEAISRNERSPPRRRRTSKRSELAGAGRARPGEFGRIGRTRWRGGAGGGVSNRDSPPRRGGSRGGLPP